MGEFDILRKTDAILDRINLHPEYSAHVAKQVKKALRNEADRHSYELEIDNSANCVNGVEKERIGEAERLSAARNLLIKGGIDLYGLSQLGYLIEQGVRERNFRDTEVAMGSVPPIKPEAVIYRAKELVVFLGEFPGHPIDRSTEAHIDMAAIHPYVDGNGRAARLLANVCLEQKGYPSAIIFSSEKKPYTKLLRDVLSDRYEGRSSFYKQSDSEEVFRDFMAAKVLASSEELEKELQRRRMYSIGIEDIPGKGVKMSIRNHLSSLGRKSIHGGVSVNFKQGRKRRTAIAQLIGDVSLDEIESVMDVAKERFGINYSLKSVSRGF